jgi:hypothetical protein
VPLFYPNLPGWRLTGYGTLTWRCMIDTRKGAEVEESMRHQQNILVVVAAATLLDRTHSIIIVHNQREQLRCEKPMQLVLQFQEEVLTS